MTFTPLTSLDEQEVNPPYTQVFIIAALVHFVGVIFYAIFASGEIQDWAVAPPEDADNMMMTQVILLINIVTHTACLLARTILTIV